MALKRNMAGNEMVGFIDNELIPQVKLEIQNWIKPKKKQGGYFVTVRQIFCITDFLGAVYSGYPLSEQKLDLNGRRIATSTKTIKFITTFFEPKQTYNHTVVTQLHDMYRNGLVHLYQPKILRLGSNKALKWFLYKGKRQWKKMSIPSNQGNIVFTNVDHLRIVRRDPNKQTYHLPICIDALYEDFEGAVQRYRDKLSTTKNLQRNWRTTVNAICKPR